MRLQRSTVSSRGHPVSPELCTSGPLPDQRGHGLQPVVVHVHAYSRVTPSGEALLLVPVSRCGQQLAPLLQSNLHAGRRERCRACITGSAQRDMLLAPVSGARQGDRAVLQCHVSNGATPPASRHSCRVSGPGSALYRGGARGSLPFAQQGEGGCCSPLVREARADCVLMAGWSSRQEYLLSALGSTLFGLVDILLAYCFE